MTKNTEIISLRDRYGSLLSGIAESLEVLSSDLAEAALVYEETDRNAV
jgi:hypothetical protein